MKHINELRFEGETPWVKAMNEANDYWLKSSDQNLSKQERDYNFELWWQLRYEIESGRHGNNS